MKNKIDDVKKNGRLIALSDYWQYWLYNGALFSVSVDGEVITLWCSESNLARHLQHLYGIKGHKFFSEGKDMTLVDKKYLAQYAYA